ncbi:MAG: serine hydrolase domain-containing protein [Dehalococcoidia bacterium]
MDAKATAAVQALLDELVADGTELGLQAVVYRNGEVVIDAAAGIADRESGRPVDGDTLFTVFSVSKGVTATCIHLLAERGRLSYDDPIARYWPAFAAEGKGQVTIRDALTHRAGLPHLPEGITPEGLCDWEGVCDGIAALSPLWEPGTETGYHAYSFGWILGEVLRRIDGRPIATFVQEEICAPINAPDIYFGIPDAVESRVATLENAPRPEGMPLPPPDALILRAIPPEVGTTGQVFNRADVRRAAIPAAGGIMSARSLARHYAALIGEVDGVRLLPAERIAAATALQTDATDVVIGVPTRKGLGYFLGGPRSPMSERISAFGHPGAGGSIGFADPEYGLAVGFTKNMLRAALDPTQASAYRVGQKIREALGIPSAEEVASH